MKNPVAQFYDTIEKFEIEINKNHDAENRLVQLKDSFVSDMENKGKIFISSLTESNPLVMQIKTVSSRLNDIVRKWDQSQNNQKEMKDVSDSFKEKIFILIYGKVNAGKSSFSNFFVDRYKSLSKSYSNSNLSYFKIEQGKKQGFHDDKFATGATETTAILQGIEMNNFVLLDSPGLRSVTEENGELTKMYTDAADAFIWLTSSVAPGQAQELEDLVEEVKKNKPFMPVITKSDYLHEDEDSDGNIVKELFVKDRERQKLQEVDVKKRAVDKMESLNGNLSLLKEPISVSVHYCEQNNNTDEALEQSGLNTLYSELTSIIQEASEYKVKKSSQQVINYLENIILKSLNENMSPVINELRESHKKWVEDLLKNKEKLSNRVKIQISIELDSIIDKYKTKKDVAGYSIELNKSISLVINKEITLELERYFSKLDEAILEFLTDDLGTFSDKTIDITQKKGALGKGLLSATGSVGGGLAGATAGAALGTIVPFIGNVVGGIVGGIVGSIVGGGVGNAAGEAFAIQEYTVTEKIGISTEEIKNNTMKMLDNGILQSINIIIDSLIESLSPISSYITSFELEISNLKKEIEKVKEII